MTLSRFLSRASLHAFLIFVGFASIVPIVLIWFASLKTNTELSLNPLGLPRHWVFSNWVSAWQTAHLSHYVLNSVVVSAIAVAGPW
jgi:raffinose/stachyose/melibiose transport system permease protein